MAAAGDLVVEARGIQKSFGGVHVLRGLDLTVRRHETVVIVGPSGSGKTTFLRCLNLLESPTQGTVRVGDIEVAADPLGQGGRERGQRVRKLRAQVGMVFQEFNLFPHMTVLENCIEAPMSVKGIPRAEAVETAERYLEKVHLVDKRYEHSARLSSGQKQRAAIARALCMAPQLLLFDEPTSALDPELVGEVVAVMEELAHEGATMIVVTHQILFARAAADRVLFMQEGRIVEQGPPAQVLEEPQEELTRRFLRRYLVPGA
jgi:polar amino acid transport system ATP-binding protein